MKQGIITQEEFEKKKSCILGDYGESVKLSSQQEGQLKILSDLHKKGLITQQEFESKRQKILSNSDKSNSVVSVKKPVKLANQVQRDALNKEQVQMLNKLEDFLKRGIITQDEFNRKYEELIKKTTKQTTPRVTKIEIKDLAQLTEEEKHALVEEERRIFKENQLALARAKRDYFFNKAKMLQTSSLGDFEDCKFSVTMELKKRNEEWNRRQEALKNRQ